MTDQWQILEGGVDRSYLGYELADPAVLTHRYIARSTGPNRHERRAAAKTKRVVATIKANNMLRYDAKRTPETLARRAAAAQGATT